MFGGLGSKKSILSRKSLVGDFVPNAIANGAWNCSFTDDCTSSNYTPSQAVQIIGIDQPISFKITLTNSAPGIYYKKSSSTFSTSVQNSIDTSAFEAVGYTFVSNNGIISNINNSQYIGFAQYSTSAHSFSVYNSSSGDTLISTSQVIYNGDVCSPCFLTTAVVDYMNLRDDGPELGAMRLLRDTYKDHNKHYRQLIDDYYATSPKIVRTINQRHDKEEIYLFVYKNVKSCQYLIESNNFEPAWDLYLSMFFNLKRYLK